MYKSLRSMLLMLACAVCGSVLAQDNLKAMQQKFVNEKFGMFIHFNMPSFVDEDWPDPDMPAETFHPKCRNEVRMPDHKTPQWLLHLGHEDHGIQCHEQPPET